MCMHETKHCPRCGVAFECKVGNITQCQCYGITLTTPEQEYIYKQFADCLCLACIKNIRVQLSTEKLASLIKKHQGH